MLDRDWYGLQFRFFIRVHKWPCFYETICNSPLNYSTYLVVRFHLFLDTVLRDLARWDQPHTEPLRSYCKSILKPDPRDERPLTEEHIWHYNSMTSPFFLFFVSLHSASLCHFPLYKFFLQTKQGSSAFMKFWLSLSIWCIDLLSVANHNHFLSLTLVLSSTSAFISHPPAEPNDITWGCI